MLLATQEPKLPRADSRNLLQTVQVPTATIVVVNRDNLDQILVADSSKHALPVLSGGKIDDADITSANMQECAEVCARRELTEELGIEVTKLTHVGTLSVQDRDVREVPVKKLRGSVAGQALTMLHDDIVVKACYGEPDYILVAIVDPDSVRESSELKNPRWIDRNSVKDGVLGASHHLAVAMYEASKTMCS